MSNCKLLAITELENQTEKARTAVMVVREMFVVLNEAL